MRPRTGSTRSAPKTGAIFSRNPYTTEFADRTAFFDAGEATRTVTGDRTEFLGRNGTPDRPAGLDRGHQPERRPDDRGQHQGNPEDAHVDPHRIDSGNRSRRQGKEHLQPSERQQNAEDSAGSGEHRALDQELAG